MAVDFDFDLDEIVRFGNRDISLRRALREYIETKKQLKGGVIGPPMWLRDRGKKPGSFDASHMDALGGSIAAEDLNACLTTRARRRALSAEGNDLGCAIRTELRRPHPRNPQGRPLRF